MCKEPSAGLVLLDGLSEQLGDHHRLHAVRAHLLELAGHREPAISEFKVAAGLTSNVREQHYLTTKAAQLGADRSGSVDQRESALPNPARGDL
jgi:predicted RNA polymerase sigma factor